MLICEDCGSVLHEDELKTERSYVSDYAGGCYEDYTCCPCGGSVTEAEQCEVCGEYFKPEDLHEGMCEDCLKQEMTVDNALRCGKDASARQEVSVNGFLARCFDEEEIDALLLEALEMQINSSEANAVAIMDSAEEWCEEDIGYFAEWLKSRKEKDV